MQCAQCGLLKKIRPSLPNVALTFPEEVLDALGPAGEDGEVQLVVAPLLAAPQGAHGRGQHRGGVGEIFKASSKGTHRITEI